MEECGAEQAEGAQQADLPGSVKAEAGGELDVGLDDAAGEDSQVADAAAEAVAGKLQLQVEGVQGAEVEDVGGLGEQLEPEASGEGFDVLLLGEG